MVYLVDETEKWVDVRLQKRRGKQKGKKTRRRSKLGVGNSEPLFYCSAHHNHNRTGQKNRHLKEPTGNTPAFQKKGKLASIRRASGYGHLRRRRPKKTNSITTTNTKCQQCQRLSPEGEALWQEHTIACRTVFAPPNQSFVIIDSSENTTEQKGEDKGDLASCAADWAFAVVHHTNGLLAGKKNRERRDTSG